MITNRARLNLRGSGAAISLVLVGGTSLLS